MGNELWETPTDFFERINRMWGPFEIDAAANHSNAKCNRWWGPGSCEVEDTLKFPWVSEVYTKLSECPNKFPIWINPPYKNLMGWVNQSMRLSFYQRVVVLLPFSQWASWMEVAIDTAEIVRVVGRIKFIDPKAEGRMSPPGMNILAIFRTPIGGVSWPTGFTGSKINAVGDDCD